MKAVYSNCFRLVSILVLLMCPRIISYSCGPSMGPDDSRYALFRPELSGAGGLVPFYFTNYYLKTPEESIALPDQLVNAAEWHRYTKSNASVQDIFYLQYKISPDDFMYAYRTGDWQQLEGNSFVNWLRQHKAAMEYFAYAKQSEFWQLGNKDPWEQQDYGYIDHTDVSGNLLKAADKLKQAPDDFLRQRYAFQAVKETYYMAYYRAGLQVVDCPEARRIYEKELKGKNSIVAKWALLYYAMSHTNSNLRATYLLQAFDETEEKKEFVYHWTDTDMMDALERSTNDKHLLALAKTVKAIKNPGRALQTIAGLYELEPASKYLPLLVAREVNKIEDWIWSGDILGFKRTGYAEGDNTEDYAIINRKKDIAYTSELILLLQKMTMHKNEHEVFLRLALIHCYHIQGDFESAKNELAKLTGNNYGVVFQKQIEIENIINLLYTKDITTAGVKEEIFVRMNGLEQLGITLKKKEREYEWYYDEDEQNDDYGELLLMISRAYEEKNEIVTAGLLYQKAGILTNNYDGWYDSELVSYNKIAWFDRVASPADIDSLILFRNKKNKTNFENFISPASWPPDDFYLDLKGTKLVRMNAFDEALKTFEQVSDDFWQLNYVYADYLPKYSLASVGTLLPVANKHVDSFPVASKKLILREMTGLLHQYVTCNDRDSLAELCFLLGNCYYNISYYGKAWMIFSYGQTSGEQVADNNDYWSYDWAWFSFPPRFKKYTQNYYQLADAKAMYRKALGIESGDKELKAKCLLMLWLIDNVEESEHDSKELMSTYSNTKVYELAMTYCPDFAELMK